MFVAMDIGCYECGEPSAMLGIFSTKALADEACAEHAIRQKADWQGQHSFEIFEGELDQLHYVEYNQEKKENPV